MNVNFLFLKHHYKVLSLNVSQLRHIICLEELSEYRCHMRFSGVFKECLKAFIGCVYINGFYLHKSELYTAFYTVCPFIYYNIELKNSEFVLQCCKVFFYCCLHTNNFFGARVLIINFHSLKTFLNVSSMLTSLLEKLI